MTRSAFFWPEENFWREENFWPEENWASSRRHSARKLSRSVLGELERTVLPIENGFWDGLIEESTEHGLDLFMAMGKGKICCDKKLLFAAWPSCDDCIM